MNTWVFWFLVFLLLSSGIAQPLIIQWIQILGAGEPTTFLYMIPNYFGMVLLLFLPPNLFQGEGESIKNPPKQSSQVKALINWPRWARILLISFLDVFSFSGCLFGSLLCGSAIYSIIYGAVPVITALLAWIFLKKDLNIWQWVAIIFTTAGLSIAGIGVASSKSNSEYVVYGAIVVLVCTIMHSFFYVANEAIMNQGQDRLPPIRLCGWVGLFGLVLMILWQFCFTVPQWSLLVSEPLSKTGTPVYTVVMVYILAMIVDLLHDGVFYIVINQLGSVTTGVLKGATSVSIFVFSAILLCSIQKYQCFTTMKGISLALVVVSVLLYSYSTHQQNNLTKHKESNQQEPLLNVMDIENAQVNQTKEMYHEDQDQE